MARAMRSLRQLLAQKSSDIYAVHPETSVYEALTIMAERDVGALLVFDDGRVVGVLTERDYARKGVLAGRLSKDTPVGELMTRNVVFATPEHTVEQCMALMSDGDFRHLPVMEDGKLIGILSMRDLVREIIAHQRHVIADLKRDMITVLTPDPSSY